MSAPSSMVSGKSIGQNNAAEVITGAAVIAVAALFLAFMFTRTGSGSLSGYEIVAKIAKADGLGIGTDVDVSGIKVGTVSALTLDPKTYLVTVHMDIRDDIKIPTDSSMQVTQVGALGNQYIAIQPGGDDTNIPPGGTLSNAAGAINLMGTISHFLDSAPPKPSAPPAAAPQAQAPPATTP